MKVLSLLVAAGAGLLMAVQGSLNTALGKVIGLLEATFVVQITGTVFTAALLLAGWRTGSFAAYKSAPWYVYLGGIIGVGIVYAVVHAISQSGVAPATTAIIVGQVATAAIVGHMGWFGLQQHTLAWTDGLGLLLLAGGAFILLR